MFFCLANVTKVFMTKVTIRRRLESKLSVHGTPWDTAADRGAETNVSPAVSSIDGWMRLTACVAAWF